MASSLTGISIASSYDALIKVGDNDGLTSTLQVLSDGLGTESGISMNNTGDLTATGTVTANSFVGALSGNITGNTTVSGTLTFGSLSDGTITIADFKDEDNMASNSATALATQQSIKAYVDSQLGVQDLDFQGDAGGQQAIDLNSEVLSVVGTANEISTNSTGNALTISLNPNITGLTSVASTTFTGALTGNSSTATTLLTSRNIAGVAFNGSADISLSTANITEGSNLYYTQSRFDSAFSAKSTTNLSEGTNLYFTDARADARVSLQTGSNLNLSSKTTSDLAEGSNKYFTDERTDDRVASLIVASTGISSTYNDAAGTLTIANTAPDQTVALTGGTGISTSGTYPNFTVTNSAPDQTVSLTGSGSVSISGTYPSFTIAGSGGGIALTDLSAATSGIGSLVYDNSNGVFTYSGASTAEVKGKITKSYVDGLGIAASTAANLTGTPNISVGTITASGAITGNLTGNATSSTTAAALTTARTISGVSFDGSANITLNTSGITENTNLYYTDARFDTRLATKTTDNLTQGSSNLYNQTHTGDVTGATALTIANDAVTQAKIANDAVGADQLAANSVVTASIVDANVTTAKIADNNITTAKVLDANITTAKIADNGITTAKILDLNVTTAKIANDAVEYDQLGSGFTTTTPLSGTSVDWSTAQTFTKTLSANTTLTFASAKTGMQINLVISGNYTLTLPSSVKELTNANTYDGTGENLISIVSTNDGTEQFATINKVA